MARRDALYRRLFQHHQLLRDLLACVMEASWLDDLDWAQCKALDAHYVGDHLQQRAGDGAWRIPWRSGGQNLYLLLMLENQSRSDRYMALRMATYAGLLYQSLLRQKEAGLLLPPLLPVVLYSGSQPWSAPREVSGLLQPVVPDLAGYQLGLRYVLVDQGALLQAGGLPERNLAAVLFRLEHSQRIEEIPQLLHTLMQVIRGPGHEELERSFSAYIRQLMLMRAKPSEPVPTTFNLQELSMLISEKPGLWARQWEEEGRKKGREEGRQEGRVEGLHDGQAALLQRQLTRKFGPLPAEVVQRIESADLKQIETWSLNFVDAHTLDDVFH